jgi:hypothetical protein
MAVFKTDNSQINASLQEIVKHHNQFHHAAKESNSSPGG